MVTLWKVFVALLLLWLCLLVSGNTLHGFAHVFFVAAIIIGLIQILWRRQAI